MQHVVGGPLHAPRPETDGGVAGEWIVDSGLRPVASHSSLRDEENEPDQEGAEGDRGGPHRLDDEEPPEEPLADAEQNLSEHERSIAWPEGISISSCGAMSNSATPFAIFRWLEQEVH